MSKEYPHKASADYFCECWDMNMTVLDRWETDGVHCGERPCLTFVTFENVLHKIYVYLDVEKTSHCAPWYDCSQCVYF